MKKIFPLHPFLFAMFPVLSCFSYNIKHVSFFETVLPSVITLIFSLLLFLLFTLATKNTDKGAMIATLFLALFFTYGHLYDALGMGKIFIGRHRYLWPFLLLVFAITAYLIKRIKMSLHNLTKILNVATACLIIIPLINISAYKLKMGGIEYGLKGKSDLRDYIENSKNPDRLPDIYYFVFDRYARADTFKKIYDFDNSGLIDYLTDKGFYVASESYANYFETAQSLASSLNMEYINYLRESVGEDSDYRRPLYRKMQDYKIWRFLKAKGYKYIHFGNNWEVMRINRYADMNVNLHSVPQLLLVIYAKTIIYPISTKLGIYDIRLEQYRRLIHKFNKLANMPKIKEPIFVFAHILLPHDPFVVDRKGNFLTEAEAEERAWKENYIDQVIFANKKIKKIIDKLLSNSDFPPIIILQSDEGPYPLKFEDGVNYLTIRWNEVPVATLKGKAAILNAYYLPGVDKSNFYPSLTPVNSFRLVFNLYFNAGFEILPDEIYTFKDKMHPYQFINVTEKLREWGK